MERSHDRIDVGADPSGVHAPRAQPFPLPDTPSIFTRRGRPIVLDRIDEKKRTPGPAAL
jgi:hypothetical protein